MKYLVIAAIILFMFWYCCVGVKENFTIAKREGVFCDPKIANFEGDLLPNSEVFVIQGYNYKQTPKIYRDGKKIVPLQLFWNPSAMAYYFTVYAPDGLCGSEWILETTDFVEPVVNDGRTGKSIKVDLARRRDDFNKWMLYC
jgi:hypothetical protein